MSCLVCLSRNQEEFRAEINIHFAGVQNLTKPTVWVFPKISVCLDCGASSLTIPRKELAELGGTGQAATGLAAESN